jgi:dTDP-4-amino-4,6-dideoxy-D-galactose acyltransferase
MSSTSLRAIDAHPALGASAKPVCERLAWDSEFFGIHIGRLWGNRLTRERVDEALRWRRAYGIDCLYFLADASGSTTALIAATAGFRVVDIRCTYECSSLSRRPVLVAPAVRPFEPADLPALERIASENHRDTRFYFDGNFSQEHCDRLYATWIRRSCSGWADAVYVAGFQGEPVGYVTCHLDEAGCGSIGLIAVAPECRGQGFGQQLVTAALEHLQRRGVRRVEVVTQGRNIRSQQMYQRSGFILKNVEVWHHLWAKPQS